MTSNVYVKQENLIKYVIFNIKKRKKKEIKETEILLSEGLHILSSSSSIGIQVRYSINYTNIIKPEP